MTTVLSEVGLVIKPHGLDGALKIRFYHHPSDYKKLNHLFIGSSTQSLPFFIKKIQQLSNHADFIVHFDEIYDRQQASKYNGTKLFIEESYREEIFPNETVSNPYVICEGYEIDDEKYGTIGKIEAIMELPQQYLASMTMKGCEVLIPLNAQTVLHIDHQNKILAMRIPDGLLDVYLC